MATTTNFGWETPDDTDLVKDGALAIRTLGNSIDTSLVDLKGGTTGQVLSKNSNTDMDFTWVTSDDANAIQNAIVDAKGDLIAASAADTPARLAVGNNGETLVADSSATTGLRWQGNFAAGKNAIINGAFDIWQRGTSFSYTGSGATTFTADRCSVFVNGNGTFTFSRQTFTPGAAPVAGYEAQYFYRFAVNTLGTSTTAYILQNKCENVQTFAGQTTTLSFWAKSDASRTISIEMVQDFGSGGSAAVTTNSSVSVGTSWARYTATITMPSISGKTIGTGSNVIVRLVSTPSASQTVDIWGLQWEAGNVATAFQTATGTLAGERSACQRYFYRLDSSTAGDNYMIFGSGYNATTTRAYAYIPLPVTMRVAPTITFSSTASQFGVHTGATTVTAGTGMTAVRSGTENSWVWCDVASGLTAGDGSFILANNSSAAFINFSSEL